MTKKGKHALVLGGGIGGLSAAGVLASQFDEVTLVERDRYDADRAAVRAHTPHGAHAHLLLAGGLVTLTRLVPELPGWLDELGAPEGDLTHHTRVAFEGQWLPRARSGIPIRTCTRADVEHVLKRDVDRRGNVRILDDRRVVALVGDPDHVRGVKVARAGGDGDEELTADFVVDAMGRGSLLPDWLKQVGVAPVEELVVDAGIVYASAWFEPPAGIDDDWTVLATLPSMPSDAQMGVLVRFGNNRMLCSVVSYGKPSAPTSTEELLARLAALKVPHLHRVLSASKRVSDIVSFGNTKNRWRRYGKLASFPRGIVAIGDAVCGLNPRYGQGMTVASLSADLLDRELKASDDLASFSLPFQKRLDGMLMIPWQIALMEDRAWVSSLAGAKLPWTQRLAVAGATRVLRTAFSDVDTYIRFMRVAHLLDSPTAMLAPGTIARIARGGGAPVGDHAPGIGARAA